MILAALLVPKKQVVLHAFHVRLFLLKNILGGGEFLFILARGMVAPLWVMFGHVQNVDLLLWKMNLVKRVTMNNTSWFDEKHFSMNDFNDLFNKFFKDHSSVKQYDVQSFLLDRYGLNLDPNATQEEKNKAILAHANRSCK